VESQLLFLCVVIVQIGCWGCIGVVDDVVALVVQAVQAECILLGKFQGHIEHHHL
jgi:hypothetical protein